MKGKKDLVLVGGGGHCKACIDVIESGSEYRIAGIVDPKAGIQQALLGYPYIGTDADLERLSREYQYFFVGVGQIRSPQTRIKIYRQLGVLGVARSTIVSPRAHVSRHAAIGAGTIIMHGAIVQAGAIIGENCIINDHAIVEHDARIAAHCHISTAAVINGEAKVGEGCFVGSGCIVFQNAAIPPYQVISAGSIFRK